MAKSSKLSSRWNLRALYPKFALSHTKICKNLIFARVNCGTTCITGGSETPELGRWHGLLILDRWGIRSQMLPPPSRLNSSDQLLAMDLALAGGLLCRPRFNFIPAQAMPCSGYPSLVAQAIGVGSAWNATHWAAFRWCLLGRQTDLRWRRVEPQFQLFVLQAERCAGPLRPGH